MAIQTPEIRELRAIIDRYSRRSMTTKQLTEEGEKLLAAGRTQLKRNAAIILKKRYDVSLTDFETALPDKPEIPAGTGVNLNNKFLRIIKDASSPV